MHNQGSCNLAGVGAVQYEAGGNTWKSAANGTQITTHTVSDVVLSLKDAGQLTGANRGVIYVREPQGRVGNVAADFDAGTFGASSEVGAGNRAVPALRYDHPSPTNRTYNFVKFDGIEGGNLLIDAKISMTSFEKQEKAVQRVDRALAQNPGFKAVYEFPTQAAANDAQRLLTRWMIQNITVRVRK